MEVYSLSHSRHAVIAPLWRIIGAAPRVFIGVRRSASTAFWRGAVRRTVIASADVDLHVLVQVVVVVALVHQPVHDLDVVEAALPGPIAAVVVAAGGGVVAVPRLVGAVMVVVVVVAAA